MSPHSDAPRSIIHPSRMIVDFRLFISFQHVFPLSVSNSCVFESIAEIEHTNKIKTELLLM